MTLPHDDIDPDGYLEYSVVFTDRSLNHMSARFTQVMQDIRDVLIDTYDAHSVAIVPGGGSYGMEAVARQLFTGKRALIVRNGLFSFRWSQIIDMGGITDDVTVLKARQTDDEPTATWEPAPIDEVVSTIHRDRPDVVIAPHVETAAGIQLTDAYLAAMAEAAHQVGALVVLDCVASGASWVSMKDSGIDVLVSAPQKGWSGTPGAGYVMLSEAARTAVDNSTSSSFAADLKKWLFITDEYAEGRTPYHATLPTDGLAHNAELMLEARDRGLENLRAAQIDLGTKVRAMLSERGIKAISSDEFAAPSVVVAYTDDPAVKSGAKFKDGGVQVAGGVPLQCDEPAGFSTFRLGLFGLDKLADVDGTVQRLSDAMDKAGI